MNGSIEPDLPIIAEETDAPEDGGLRIDKLPKRSVKTLEREKCTKILCNIP
jgi:hypothetical protein